MENQLEKDIIRIYKRIDEAEKDLEEYKMNPLMLKDIRADLVRFESELTRKQSLLHRVLQDRDYKNIEIEARVAKLTGKGEDVEDLSEVYQDVYMSKLSDDGGEEIEQD